MSSREIMVQLGLAGGLLGGLFLCSAGCSPTQEYIMKEKVTNANPRAGIQDDRFAYGKAMGSVDVLFVVDNTDSGEAAIPAFQKSYADFAARFARPEARLLDYRLQVVTDPSGKSPGDFVSNTSPPSAQLAELFGAADGSVPGLLNHSERGYLSPFTNAASGLLGKAFASHGAAPVFVVFVLGWDADPNGAIATDAAQFAGAVQASRGFYQTHLMTISRVSAPGTRAAGGFPHCDTFAPATQILSQLSALPWRSQTGLDLCDNGWTSYADTLFPAVVAFKKKIVLSHVPDFPETMVLRDGSHKLYRYGDDYRFDKQGNEIVFLRDPGLQEGDLFDVQYYLPKGATSGAPDEAPPGPIPAGS